jgi:hypothetical protein
MARRIQLVVQVADVADVLKGEVVDRKRQVHSNAVIISRRIIHRFP